MSHDTEQAALIKTAVELGVEAGVKRVLHQNAVRNESLEIDVTRIPLICQAIVSINKDIEGIKDNIRWGVRIVVGAVIMALVAVVLKTD